jgi:mannonate dehydratase
MKTDRRNFVRLALAGSMGGLLSLAFREEAPKQGIRLGTFFKADPDENDFAFLKNTGVECVSVWTGAQNNDYDFMIRTRRRFEAHSVQVYNIGILDLHCDPTIVLGLPGFDKKVEQYQTYLANLGRAGIRYTTYAHMSNIKGGAVPNFYQTSQGATRGRAPTREFDLDVARKLPLSFGRVYEAEHIWKTFTEFIRAVMPAAEKAGVRIGLHPDDPPIDSLGGVARIFTNFSGYQRALEIAQSDHFGFCFCVGTWAEGGTLMGKDVIQMIRHFGPQKKIFKVHFRNVSSPLPKFRETFVDNGYLDMYQVMRALREVNFDGAIIPDHVPGGGFQPVNDSFTIGYMKALRDRVNAEYQKA